MNQQVAVIGEHPLGLVVTLDAVGQLSELMFELQPDFIANGLDLALIGAGADDEIVGEGGDTGEIENLYVGGFLGFGGADGDEPGGRFSFGPGIFLDVGLGQNTLLSVSYYGCKPRLLCEKDRRIVPLDRVFRPAV